MRLTIADLLAVFRLPPKEAIAYLKHKGLVITWDAAEMQGKMHQRAFTVAGILKLDALEAIHNSLKKALSDGLTYKQWVKNISTELEKQGLLGRHKLVNPGTGELKTVTPWRLRTIYQTNLQSAYMAGRYAQMQSSTDSHPYWQYVAVLDSRTRPAHRALHGKIYRHDDPFWGSFYPPLGYNCRCRVRPVSAATARREGLSASDSGETVYRDTPAGKVAISGHTSTAPGCAHSPAAADQFLADSLQRRLRAYEAQND